MTEPDTISCKLLEGRLASQQEQIIAQQVQLDKIKSLVTREIAFDTESCLGVINDVVKATTEIPSDALAEDRAATLEQAAKDIRSDRLVGDNGYFARMDPRDWLRERAAAYRKVSG